MSDLISFNRPRIYEGNPSECPLSDFDAVTLYLDGRPCSDLKWELERQLALEAMHKGLLILWNLDLGLFEGLRQPLSHQGQFNSIALSIEHFMDSIWAEFQNATFGISLYRGIADFSVGFRWDSDSNHRFQQWLKDHEISQEDQHDDLAFLFCRDVALDYATLLASRLPDTLPVYLFLDAATYSGSLLRELQGLNPEAFERFHLALRGSSLPIEAIGWQVPNHFGYSGDVSISLPDSPSILFGVSVPSKEYFLPSHYQGVEKCVSFLDAHHIPFKLIAESQITAKWDGLDYLLYCPESLSLQGKRKLLGFCAAGGTALSSTNPIGLPLEQTFEEWCKNK
jgi:hypothetical protein